MPTTTEKVTLEQFIAQMDAGIRLRQLWRNIAAEAQSPDTPDNIRQQLIQTLESLTEIKITT